MSHLYSMFAKQVASYCKNLPEDSPSVTQCKRNLLMYGLNKLQDMSEIHLDTMDPYQRGANDISKYYIWSDLYSDSDWEWRLMVELDIQPRSHTATKLTSSWFIDSNHIELLPVSNSPAHAVGYGIVLLPSFRWSALKCMTITLSVPWTLSKP